MTRSEEDIFSIANQYLPAYLSPREKQDLVLGLKDFPDHFQYYLPGRYQDEALQGDVWKNFTVIEFNSGERKSVRGIILSNSCDIDTSNQRDLPVHVSFVPLIQLSKLEALLVNRKSVQAASSVVEAIKLQQSTSFFYLPEHEDLPESVAYLPDIHSKPMDAFKNQSIKLVTLSQQGFYMFLLKLSIHFCRFQENIARFD